MKMKKKAQLSQLKELSKNMSDEIGDSYSKSMPMKKVTVAADSKEGLEKGLSKAQELMKKRGLMETMEDDAPCEKSEKSEESSDDLKKKIKEAKSKLKE
jgi:hypothetical protein